MKTRVPGDKPLRTELRTNKLSPHVTPGPRPGAHWWKNKRSHHCANPSFSSSGRGYNCLKTALTILTQLVHMCFAQYFCNTILLNTLQGFLNYVTIVYLECSQALLQVSIHGPKLQRLVNTSLNCFTLKINNTVNKYSCK